MKNVLTGIGSRKAPPHIIGTIKYLMSNLQDWHVRTGDAIGCDAAFAESCNTGDVFTSNLSSADIYGDRPNLVVHTCKDFYNWDYAVQIAKQFHPKYNSLGPDGKGWITRNTYQVLGEDLMSPTKIIVCWTPDGATTHTTITTGGTGQAIRLGHHLSIPIINLAITDVDQALQIIKALAH